MKNDLLRLPQSGFPPLLHLTYHLQQLADDRLVAEVGLGLSQVRIMSALGTSPISQRAIALSLGQTEANVSRQLKLMKKAGLVNIVKNKKDARQRDVSLTSLGQSKYQKAEAALATLEKFLTKEIKNTI